VPDNTAMTEIDGGTAGSEITPAPTLPQTDAPTLSQLTDEVGYLHNRAKLLHDDTVELHLDVIMQEWGSTTTDLVRLDMPSLLGRLADLGFAWRDIARLIGVSVPAVQKWRRGGAVSGQSRTSAAAVLAACEIITRHYLVQDIASWFESPIIVDVPVTPLDLYAEKRVSLVFQLASGKADPERVLTAFDPEWRESYRSEFEVFQADDGLALRRREH